MFEKRRFRNFLIFCQEFDLANPKTHKGLNFQNATAQDIYKVFGVDKNTIDFTGHSLALYLNDE